MKPYCRNNSNFTFREICCGPRIYDDCYNNKCDCNKFNDFEHECTYQHKCNCGHNNHNCNCGHNNHNCNCEHKPKPTCKPKDKDNILTCKPPYICLPIKKLHPNKCNPFLYVMIGYMIGNDFPFCSYDTENENDN